MKKLKKFVSTLLAFSFVVSCMIVSASAVGQSRTTPSNILTNVDDYDVIYSKNGIEIIIASFPMPVTRGSHSTSGSAADTAYIDFRCKASDGNYCHVFVDNVDNSADMRVTFDYNVNGETVSCSYPVEPSDGCMTYVRDKNGNGLTCTIYTTIEAVGAPSVQYEYFAEQFNQVN